MRHLRNVRNYSLFESREDSARMVEGFAVNGNLIDSKVLVVGGVYTNHIVSQ